MKRIVLSFLLLFSVITTFAYEMEEINGIFYIIDLKNKIASVTNNGQKNQYGRPTGTSYSGSVTIPSSITYNDLLIHVTSIGYRAFCNCTSLESVTIPNSVEIVGEQAFWGCSSLKVLNIPNSVTDIYNSAFAECSSLTSVNIPNSIESIGENPFQGCTQLSNIETNNQKFFFKNDCLYSKEGVLISGLDKSTITIPSSVTKIGDAAFCGCRSLTSINIPNSITSIGDWAFCECVSLYSIDIPNSVKNIGNSVFNHCTSLTSVTIPNSVTSIKYGTFEACSSLNSVTIPNSVTRIEDTSFCLCKSLTHIDIPNSVKNIGGYAFQDCISLTTMTIPNSVSKIENSTFSNCTSLSSVTLGNSVNEIGVLAFSNCTSLSEIYSLNPTPPRVGIYAFDKIEKLSVTVFVPEESIDKYIMSNGWNDFTNWMPLNATSNTPLIVDTTEQSVFYDLNGCEILKPQAGQVVIRKQGSKTKKYRFQ